MIGCPMRGLWRRWRAHVKGLSESVEWKVGRVEERWVVGREEGGLCSFSLLVCEKKETSWRVLYLGTKKGSCQEEREKEREHRLASLPRQTQNLIATGAKASGREQLTRFISRQKRVPPVRTRRGAGSSHLFVRLKPEHLIFPRRLHQ